MEKNEKFYFRSPPDWAEAISNEEIATLSQEDKKTKNFKDTGKGVCYLYKKVINTTNSKNQEYLLNISDISNSDILQSFLVSEFNVGDNQHIEIHRFSVKRNGVIIDKKDDLNIRIIDDESSSASGSINKRKKIHCVISDLRLNDAFILEYSFVTIFNETNFLDKSYFKYSESLPEGYWFYKKYLCKLIQNREEKIVARQREFRDLKNEKIKDTILSLEKGEIYKFEQLDFHLESKEDQYSPFIEISTDTSWESISSYLSELYKDNLYKENLCDSEVVHLLSLDTEDQDIEYKIQGVIEYVQNNIAYLYDQEVMHGYIPQSSHVTLETKSGDCKAKSLLLIRLLDLIGVKAEFILINYSYDYFITTSLPSPFLFNHIIVKIHHNDRDYFVDPTWNNRYGILEKRTQPYFSNFLPIVKNATIQSRERLFSPDIYIEENVDIEIKNSIGLIKITSTYRNNSADDVRNNFQKENTFKVNQNANRFTFGNLSYTDKKYTDDFFKEVTYKIISDDKQNNILTVYYEAKVNNIYQRAKYCKIFKFYNYLNINNILNYRHKDHLCSSFASFPIRIIVNIKSDLFIDRFNSVVDKEIEIDNNYFSFYNKKSIGLRKAKVISEFKPKNYNFISKDEFEKIKNDFMLINKSNFGIGIKFRSVGQFFFTYAVWIIIIFSLISLLSQSK